MNSPHRSESTPRVLLLHGIWNARSWVAPLAWRLRAQGFKVDVFGYPSVFGGPDVALPALVQRLRESGPVNVVGHSLGGVMALEALRRAPDAQVPRLVCVGSPLCGSLAARNLALRPWTAPLLGRSAALLQSGCEPWKGPTEVGVVAGVRARGIGRLLARFDGDSDGTVSVAETRLEGLADHCTVSVSHTGLVFSAEAARRVGEFLREGRFQGAGATEMASPDGVMK